MKNALGARAGQTFVKMSPRVVPLAYISLKHTNIQSEHIFHWVKARRELLTVKRATQTPVLHLARRVKVAGKGAYTTNLPCKGWDVVKTTRWLKFVGFV